MNRRPLLAALVLMPSLAQAHEPRKGPHGGILVDAGAYHVEIIMQGVTVEVYVSDGADRPVPAAGFKATAILAIDGKSQRIVLVPADGNKLAGQSAIATQGALKGAVLLTAPDGKTAQAKIE